MPRATWIDSYVLRLIAEVPSNQKAKILISYRGQLHKINVHVKFNYISPLSSHICEEDDMMAMQKYNYNSTFHIYII